MPVLPGLFLGSIVERDGDVVLPSNSGVFLGSSATHRKMDFCESDSRKQPKVSLFGYLMLVCKQTKRYPSHMQVVESLCGLREKTSISSSYSVYPCIREVSCRSQDLIHVLLHGLPPGLLLRPLRLFHLLFGLHLILFRLHFGGHFPLLRRKLAVVLIPSSLETC